MKNGADPSKTITFAYDDIAQHWANPLKGYIINQPEGHDVYSNCKIDYSKESVNAKTFIEVMRGKGSEHLTKTLLPDE